MLARIVGYVKDKPEIDRNYVFYYENNAKKDKHRRKLKLLCGILKKIVFAILCFLIVISPELTGDYWTAKAMQNSWIKTCCSILEFGSFGYSDNGYADHYRDCDFAHS